LQKKNEARKIQRRRENGDWDLFSWMKEEENEERVQSILHIYAFFLDKDRV
jgi:hypothetical protein